MDICSRKVSGKTEYSPTVAYWYIYYFQDTLNEAEYWVVDFEPYNMNKNTAVDPYTGDINPENTGQCSNVMFDAPYNQQDVAAGYYFSDVGNFM